MLKAIVRAFLGMCVGKITEEAGGTVRVDGNDPEFTTVNLERFYQVTPSYWIQGSFPGSYDVTVAADFPVQPGRRNVKYQLITFSKGANAFWAFLAFWAYGFQRPDRATVEAILNSQHLKQLGQAPSTRFPIVGLCGTPRLSGIGIVDKSENGGHIARMSWLAEWQKACQWIVVAPKDVH